MAQGVSSGAVQSLIYEFQEGQSRNKRIRTSNTHHFKHLNFNGQKMDQSLLI